MAIGYDLPYYPDPNSPTGYTMDGAPYTPYSGSDAEGPFVPTATGSTSPTYDPNTASLYDLAIGNTQSAVDRLPGQLEGGYSTIESSYKNALNQLLGGKNRAEGEYGTNKLQTSQDWRTGKNTISSQAGGALQGLLRLLGIRGAGGGSAYQFGAPNAVITGANQQRGALGQTFGRNAQALDTNWGNYMTDYGNSVLDVKNQRGVGRQSLEDQFRTDKGSLLQQLAELQAQKAAYIGGDPTAASSSYLDKANTLLGTVGTAKTAPIKYSTKAYQAPSLDKYLVGPGITPTYNPQQTGDTTSPYLGALLGNKKNRLQFGY